MLCIKDKSKNESEEVFISWMHFPIYKVDSTIKSTVRSVLYTNTNKILFSVYFHSHPVKVAKIETVCETAK